MNIIEVKDNLKSQIPPWVWYSQFILLWIMVFFNASTITIKHLRGRHPNNETIKSIENIYNNLYFPVIFAIVIAVAVFCIYLTRANRGTLRRSIDEDRNGCAKVAWCIGESKRSLRQHRTKNTPGRAFRTNGTTQISKGR